MKFLMAILRGAWIVGAPWVAACAERGAPVPEEDFEVQVLFHDVCFVSTGGLRVAMLAWRGRSAKP